MKKWLLLGLLALPVPAVAQPIAYRRDLPPSVKRLMPRGTQSLFWGKFSPSKGATPMAVHLFALNRKEVAANAKTRDYAYHFMLDVFEAKKKSWQRINRVPVTYHSAMGMSGPVKISMSLLSLYESKPTPPVLLFDAFSPEQMRNSNYGDGVFVVFKDGWRKGVYVQNFGFGSPHQGGYQYGVGFNEQGVLQVITTAIEPGANITSTESKYTWNGQEFAGTGSTTKDLFEPATGD